MNPDTLRNLMGILNRYKLQSKSTERINPKQTENIYSPPHKGFTQRRILHYYPRQLSGLQDGSKQLVTLAGTANQGSTFRGAGGTSKV